MPGPKRSAWTRRCGVPLVVGVVLLSACAGDGSTEGSSSAPPESALAVPTHAGDGSDVMTAEISGRLAGDASLDGGCLWLVGSEGQQQAVLWPAGYRALYDPARLVGPDGIVVAREGQEVRASGGFLPAPGMVRCRLNQTEIAQVDLIVGVE